MPKRKLQGTVVSDKMDKTVVIEVETKVMHPKYRKFIKRTHKYHAHNEKADVKIGDTVWVQECPPKSKTEKWEVVEE